MIATANELIARELSDRELARRELVPFLCRHVASYQPGWVHWEMAEELRAFRAAVERGESPRLIITMPPRHGKSTQSTVGFPAWTWATHPDWDIIVGCYSQELANDFGEDLANLISAPSYRAIAPNTAIGMRGRERRGQAAKNRFNLTGGGRFRAVGVGGGATGRGAKVFIVDDPYKGPEEADSDAYNRRVLRWYYAVAMTRLAPGGGVLVVMTRWGENDLVGQLLEAAKVDPAADQWKVVEYPALAKYDEKHRKQGDALHPERYSREELERKRASYIAGGQVRVWNALYQCNPTPDQGVFFRREWFRTYKVLPTNLTFYAGTDWAIGKKAINDHTVIAPCGVAPNGDLYFTPDLYRRRGSTGPESVRALKGLMRRHGAMMVAYDHTLIGKALEGFIRESMGEVRWREGEGDNAVEVVDPPYPFSLWTFNPSKDKATHASALRVMLENGRVWFPEGQLFSEIILPEFLAFMGGGKHDDIVDACAWLAIMIYELAKQSAKAPTREQLNDPQRKLREIQERTRRERFDEIDRYKPLFLR
jgi:hypothetical protein